MLARELLCAGFDSQVSGARQAQFAAGWRRDTTASPVRWCAVWKADASAAVGVCVMGRGVRVG